MKYSRVCIERIDYELPDQTVASEELEDRLGPIYSRLGLKPGQIEALTGVRNRRWWPEGVRISDPSIRVGKKAIDAIGCAPKEIGAILYSGVCREYIEPATACRIASHLGLWEDAQVMDVSNACVGTLSGVITAANMIELGQVDRVLVISCESAREINESVIHRLNERGSFEDYKNGLATLTCGSGAVCITVSSTEVASDEAKRLVGGTTHTDLKSHESCRWGFRKEQGNESWEHFMSTDGITLQKAAPALGKTTWLKMLEELAWKHESIHKVITHQMGRVPRDMIVQSLKLDASQEYSTFEYLGNMGTAALPITTAIAAENGFLRSGHRVGFLGIGSGLNCIMLGLEW